jgi:hypothetical protein
VQRTTAAALLRHLCMDRCDRLLVCQGNNHRTLSFRLSATSLPLLAHRLLLNTAHTALVYLRAWHSMQLPNLTPNTSPVLTILATPNLLTAKTLRCTNRVTKNDTRMAKTMQMRCERERPVTIMRGTRNPSNDSSDACRL